MVTVVVIRGISMVRSITTRAPPVMMMGMNQCPVVLCGVMWCYMLCGVRGLCSVLWSRAKNTGKRGDTRKIIKRTWEEWVV